MPYSERADGVELVFVDISCILCFSNEFTLLHFFIAESAQALQRTVQYTRCEGHLTWILFGVRADFGTEQNIDLFSLECSRSYTFPLSPALSSDFTTPSFPPQKRSVTNVKECPSQVSLARPIIRQQQ